MIKNQIFFGCGDSSLADVGRLYLELARGLNILGGIQQPPTIHESEAICKKHEQECEEAQEALEEIATEIFIALTGRNPGEEKMSKIDYSKISEAATISYPFYDYGDDGKLYLCLSNDTTFELKRTDGAEATPKDLAELDKLLAGE